MAYGIPGYGIYPAICIFVAPHDGSIVAHWACSHSFQSPRGSLLLIKECLWLIIHSHRCYSILDKEAQESGAAFLALQTLSRVYGWRVTILNDATVTILIRASPKCPMSPARWQQHTNRTPVINDLAGLPWYSVKLDGSRPLIVESWLMRHGLWSKLKKTNVLTKCLRLISL